MDFSDVSQILTVYIHDVVDHFVVYEGDEEEPYYHNYRPT